MDPLIGLFSLLLLVSTSAFFWLSIAEDRRAAAGAILSGPAVALEDLVGTRRPLYPHTIRRTPLD
jgi:hypothetical protein